MKIAIKLFFNTVNKGYHRIEDYFTNGSFGVTFYPFLMHPCIRNSHKFIVRCIAILSAFIGLYYFFAEFIAILFSHSYRTYIDHSTLELLLPIGSLVDDRISKLSPLSYMMQITYLLQGSFIVIYLLGVTNICGTKYRLLAIITALFFSIGAIILASSQGGKYLEKGLFNLGASITFICGNLTLFITGWSIVKPFKKLRYYSIIAGFVGMLAIFTTLFIPTFYFPLIERLGIYSIILWEVAISFAILKQVEK